MSPTRTGNVLNWASDLEPNVLEQANRAGSLPFVDGHIALMPDAHFGSGATIGSVIPTNGAIIPSAVGVDIGCVDARTEYLSPMGWVRISDYAGGKVTQYHPDTGRSELVDPLAFIRRPQETFLHFRTKYGINQMLTPDHRVLCWKIVGRDRRRVQEVISAAEFASDHERLVQGRKAEFETSFCPVISTRLPLDDDQIRVQVMVMADGHVTVGGQCVLRLRKQRKIDRARKLLDDAGISFADHVGGDGTTILRFVPPSPAKTFREWWAASLSQLGVVADECLHWDGSAADRVFFTRDRASADFIQYAFAATGYRSVLRSDVRDGAVDYRVFAHTGTRVGMAGVPKTPITEVPSLDGFAYCFTVPSGFLVLRREGNIFTTGNCGMIAARCDLTSQSLPDNLGRLHGAIRAAVPAGQGKGHDESTGNSPRERRYHRFTNAATGVVPMTDKEANKAFRQFGSLGAGNHFVEVCLDEQDRVWVVLHSGSRGIGNDLAKGHIERAKGLMKEMFITLEDPDLAYFVEGTDEFKAYIDAMLWAQDYAMENREAMMDAVLAALADQVGSTPAALEVERVNCHHNFAAKEHHHGKNMWITRKGAIRAREGDRGIIPGSMGAESFIVSGLGSAASYTSCSHGAGRRMSRNKARAEIDLDTFREQMGDRVWDDRSANKLLDEAPDAYKDIHQVMADQQDLVSVDHTLTQILNYKGTK